MHCKIQPRIGKPTTKAALSRLPNFISEAVNPRTNATNKPILKLKMTDNPDVGNSRESCVTSGVSYNIENEQPKAPLRFSGAFSIK